MTGNTETIELETNDFGTKLAGIAGFLLLFVFGGFWLYNTELSSAIIVQGKVDIMGEAKIVQHRDGGLVSAIHVEPGQIVQKGDLLVELDVTEHRIRAAATTEKIKHLSARLYRLNAERNSNVVSHSMQIRPTKISFDVAAGAELTRERDLMRMRKANRISKRMQGKFKLEQLQNRIKGLDAQLASRKDEKLLLEEELAAKKHLLKLGYSSVSQLRGTQKEISVLLGKISELLSEKATLEHSFEETRHSIQNEEISFQETILGEIIAIEADTRELKKNWLTDKTVIDRAAIKAPTSGTVHKMEVFTVGGVINPSQELMQIVPENSALEIEASLETRHVDDVAPKQSAKVRLSGFDARKTPELNAFVRSVSPDIVTDPQTGKPYYQLKVTVPPEEIGKLNVDALVPGMPVEVFINTGERTAFQYLTDPLLDQLRRAFRE